MPDGRLFGRFQNGVSPRFDARRREMLRWNIPLQNIRKWPHFHPSCRPVHLPARDPVANYPDTLPLLRQAVVEGIKNAKFDPVTKFAERF